MPKRSDIRITKARVDAMAVGETIWDLGTPGFGITANKHSKTYKLKYYSPDKKQRMLKIGDHGVLTVEAARKIAVDFKSQLNKGIDPAEKKAVDTVTVSTLCERYMAEHANVAKKLSSSLSDKRNIKNHVIPLLGQLPVSMVTTNHIEKFKLDVSAGKSAPADPKLLQKKQKGGLPPKGGSGAANRCLSLLSKMFNLAEIWGLRTKGSNPVKNISRFKENPKERYLSDEELKRLMDYLDTLNDEGAEGMQYAVALIRLLVWTGARHGEIKSLQWTMVDLEGRKLNLPESKTGKKTIPLNEQAVALLRALPAVKNNPYVIVGRDGKKPLVNIQKRWKKIRSAVGLDDVRIHDLRHSFGTHALDANLSLSDIQKLMGHKSIVTTQRYAHVNDKRVQSASDTYGKYLSQVINRADGDD